MRYELQACTGKGIFFRNWLQAEFFFHSKNLFSFKKNLNFVFEKRLEKRNKVFCKIVFLSCKAQHNKTKK